RPGLGPRSLRDPQGHEEARRGEKARRLGLEQERDAALRQEFRHYRAARRGRAARQRAEGLRGPPREDGLQEGGRFARARPRGVEQALQREGRKTLTRFLRLEGIRKEFGSFTALRDIRLDVSQGEFVCFLGPSGCGKTTLLRIIAGLESQSA